MDSTPQHPPLGAGRRSGVQKTLAATFNLPRTVLSPIIAPDSAGVLPGRCKFDGRKVGRGTARVFKRGQDGGLWGTPETISLPATGLAGALRSNFRILLSPAFLPGSGSRGLRCRSAPDFPRWRPARLGWGRKQGDRRSVVVPFARREPALLPPGSAMGRCGRHARPASLQRAGCGRFLSWRPTAGC